MVVILADIVRRTNALSEITFTRRISFVNRSGNKTPSCGLQDLRREKRYPVAYALDILSWDIFFALSMLFAVPVFRGVAWPLGSAC
jgi:hypothetical protein